jgi:hypothetical protein
MYFDDVAHSTQEPRAQTRVDDVASNVCQVLLRGPSQRQHVLPGRGLHSFTSELNLSNCRTHSRVELGYTLDRRALIS